MKMDLAFVSMLLKIAGILLLGAGLIVGSIYDQRRFEEEQREFAEHIERMDRMIAGAEGR